jgi:dephospho-CoA kinase
MSYFGLTGGIASGKSTVARMFEELGAQIINADEIGHELLRPPLSAFHQIVDRFGNQLLDATGVIDRNRLGKIVFADTGKLDELNAILHPRIIERVEELAEQFEAANPGGVIIVDAALIFEAGIGGRFRKVIVVCCRPEQQVERLMAKARLRRAEAERRIAAQIPVEEKRRRADFLIDSSGSLDSTRAQVGQIYGELKALVESHRWDE